MRNFRELEIWKESVAFCTEIYAVIQLLPKEEKYGLSSQMKRSAVSIPSNIAEGCRGSNKELKMFLGISLGSSFELETQLEISKNIGYLEYERFELVRERLNILQRRINAFRNSVK